MESPKTDPRPTINHEKATLLLPLSGEDFLNEPVRAAIKSLGLREREELHLTVVGFDTGARLQEISPNAAERLENLGRESGAWAITPLPRFFYVEKDEELDGQPYRRQSLIQECAAPGLEIFYAALAKEFGESFPVPFPHVTLGANSNIPGRELRGIGIYSRSDLEGMDVVREVVIQPAPQE